MSPGAFLALLALPPLLAAEPPAPAAGSVALKFAWPSPLRCEVEHKTALRSKEGAPPRGNTVRLSLDSVRAGGGWLVREKVVSATSDPPTDAHKAMDPHELEILLYPPFTVTKEGAFGGLELAKDDRAILERRQERQRKMAEMARRLDPNLPAVAEEDALSASTKRAASSWNFLVGAWAGKELPEGENPALRVEREQTLPFYGSLHVVDRMKLTRNAPCKPSPRGGCVKLEVTSEPAGASPKQRYHVTTTLITDPRTLVPRSYSRVMDMAADTTEPNGTQVVETMTFRCK